MFNFRRYCQIAFQSGCRDFLSHQQDVSSSLSPSLITHTITQVGHRWTLFQFVFFLHRANFYSVQFHDIGLKHKAIPVSIAAVKVPKGSLTTTITTTPCKWPAAASLYSTPPPLSDPGSHWSDLHPYKSTFPRFSSKWNPMVCSLLGLAFLAQQTVFEFPPCGGCASVVHSFLLLGSHPLYGGPTFCLSVHQSRDIWFFSNFCLS